VTSLKDYVLKVAEEGFHQAVRQVIFLYGVSADDNEFDVEKDVFQCQLVLIEVMAGKNDEEEVPEKGIEEEGGDKEGTPAEEANEVEGEVSAGRSEVVE